MNTLQKTLATLSLVVAAGAGAAAAEPRVVVSIKPLHALTASVMAGVGTPDLLMDGAASPHSFALRPSQAGMVAKADLIVWIGPELETFLEKPIASLGANASPLTLAEIEGLKLLEAREGDHGHGDADGHHDTLGHDEVHDQGDDHAHDAEIDHDDDHTAHDDHADGGDHHHGGIDMHLWLDTENAAIMTEAIGMRLSELDPDNAAVYAENTAATLTRLKVLEADILAQLAPVADKPFVVFHDAYQYFETRFGLTSSAAITINPDMPPGAERIATLRDDLRGNGTACIFAEAQFDSPLIAVIAEGTDVRIGRLDPLGAEIEPGPDAYESLMRAMADSFAACLTPAG